MATHSSVLAWRIPGTGEPGGLPSYRVAQSRTRLKQRSSSSSSMEQETRIRSRGREDPLEKEMAAHSSILAWEIPWIEEFGGL